MTYNDYLKKKKIKSFVIIFFQIFLFIAFLILWQYLSTKNYINSFITSCPKNIYKTLINLYKQNQLFPHIFTTIKETLYSFTIVSFLSLIISILLYYFKTFQKIIDPYLTIMNSMPKVALGPIIIIWLGANIKSIVTMSILIAIIISIQNIYSGFENTDKQKIKLLKLFNANKIDLLFYLLLPENKKTILNTLKINISMCLIGTITGEFLTSKQGIGYLILYGSQVFNLDLVMSGIFLLIFISMIMYELLNILSKRTK